MLKPSLFKTPTIPSLRAFRIKFEDQAARRLGMIGTDSLRSPSDVILLYLEWCVDKPLRDSCLHLAAPYTLADIALQHGFSRTKRRAS